MIEDRVISPELIYEDDEENDRVDETTLRPQAFNEYIGQDKVKENLKVYIEAAKTRGEALDHVLLYLQVLVKQHLLQSYLMKWKVI